MPLAIFLGISILTSFVFIRIGMLTANRLGVMDHPGGHKQHDTSTPFVGGFGILAALIGALYLADRHIPDISLSPVRSIAIGAIILFITGLADDIWHLNFRTRFVVQALVAASMALLGGIKLHSLGGIIPGMNIELGLLTFPFTIFATIGLINALNMIDGIDGLSGTLSLVSLGFTALVAGLAGNGTYLALSISLMGGVAGFLYYNLRYPGNGKARVFLGDNGSMLLGFVFAWMFIALSQGEQRAMTPVTALWLFAIPLMDTVGVMLRRIWLGRSPFHADRNHLHHLFIRAGFRVSDTVWTIFAIQIVLGAIGLAGMTFNLPESLMFWLFLAAFAAYFYVIARPWRFVPNLRRLGIALGLPSCNARGIFIGYFHKADCTKLIEALSESLRNQDDYRISLHQLNRKTPDARNIYAMVNLGNGEDEDEAAIGKIRRRMLRIRGDFGRRQGLQVRLFMRRSLENERRSSHGTKSDKGETRGFRAGDRRTLENSTEFYSTTGQRNSGEPHPFRV